MSRSVSSKVERLVGEGLLAPDDGQARVAAALDRLAEELGAQPTQPAQGWRRLLGGNGRRKPVRGLYIHGEVGRGKTMLMDLFHAGVAGASKRRSHFHAFMQDVHARIHKVRQLQKSGHLWDDADPIALVAEDVATESRLLCFDEFQVTDIADAMILGRLFEALFRHGVVVVATSNTAPVDLYRNGLNRGVFLPFIALIEERLDTVEMDAGRDYRLDRVAGEETFLWPLDGRAEAAQQALWAKLTETARGEPQSLPVLGRTLTVPEAARGVARFPFAALCGEALGPADYLALAQSFHTLFVTGIPKLGRDRHNEARRFVTLIDTLYEKGVRLVATATTPAEEIYKAGEGDAAFQRTVSRLAEMRSEGYWNAPRPDRRDA